MSAIRITIKLYGVFKSYTKNGLLDVSVPAPDTPITIEDLALALYSAIRESAQLSDHKLDELHRLIESSVFAKGENFLDEKNLALELMANDEIAVLPPVCGG